MGYPKTRRLNATENIMIFSGDAYKEYVKENGVPCALKEKIVQELFIGRKILDYLWQLYGNG
jgi:hypothetical protein